MVMANDLGKLNGDVPLFVWVRVVDLCNSSGSPKEGMMAIIISYITRLQR